jgi:hypothetical protein
MSWRVVVAIFLLSLAVRLAYVTAFPAGPLETNAISYDTIGWNLARGHLTAVIALMGGAT